jgi:putative tryptophan/tyrosine transport system substrate-binding protein
VSGIRRRDFILLGGVVAAAWPLAARAQPTRLPRIGWLVTGSLTSYRFSLAAFRDGLKALNYIEGQNISIEYRWAEGKIERLPELARSLVHEKVDIILAGGSAGAQAAKHATSVIPIVTVGAGDLVDLGLVESLARPGGNLTGFVVVAPEGAAKRFQIIREMRPENRRAAVLWNFTSSYSKLEWAVAKEFATANDIAVEPHGVRDLDELRNGLASIAQSSPDILVVLNDPLLFTHRKIIVDAAAQLRLPAIYGLREYADDGGLISYGASVTDSYRRAAGYVDKILRGVKPTDLPIELPTRFEMVINLKTAKALGIEIPPTLLARADEVIE